MTKRIVDKASIGFKPHEMSEYIRALKHLRIQPVASNGAHYAYRQMYESWFCELDMVTYERILFTTHLAYDVKLHLTYKNYHS